VLLCDGCDACYHLECTDLTEIPSGRWFCPVCQLHNSKDVISLDEMAASMTKHRFSISPLGFDRHGRLYWFVAKRIFV
jgi:nucleosome-remodeling factor subunit BPTF